MNLEKLLPNSVFTERDDSIFKETSSDPLGMRVIWTYYGQLIFNQKLTTVATDIRNYTVNLMNYSLLFQLDDILSHYASRHKVRKDDISLGLLIMLEDIITYSLIEGNEVTTNNNEVDLGGVLGSWKGQIRYQENLNPVIKIDKNAGIWLLEFQ